MHIDRILHDLATSEDIPRDSVRAATERRAEIVPILLKMVDDYVAGKLPENQLQTVFYAFFLFGQWRETAAYRPLCRFLRMPRDKVDDILGITGVTEDSHRVMASVFDGDPVPLHDLIHDTTAAEAVRAMMCLALAMVTARGQVPHDATKTFLRDAFDRLRPRTDCYVWCGWQESVALLGFADLRPLVVAAFKRGSIDPQWTELKFFDEDLNKALANGCADIAGGEKRYSLFGDAITEFSAWYGFSEAGQRERIEAKQKAALALLEPSPPAGEGIGRGDPFAGISRKALCPCGSGRKFKHCHGRVH